VWVVGIGVFLLWLPGWLPGGQWVSVAMVLVLAAFTAIGWRLRRNDYVSFQADGRPQTPPASLPPETKIGVHVTGLLSVEGREQRFTWLPAFYRTFATREHALICHCNTTHSLGIGRWPNEEIGLWYVFFRPDEIRLLNWGRLHYGRYARRTIVVDYEQVITNPRNERQRTIRERLYIACDNEMDAHLVFADLLWDTQKSAK
jgi:hypothetical protein